MPAFDFSMEYFSMYSSDDLNIRFLHMRKAIFGQLPKIYIPSYVDMAMLSRNLSLLYEFTHGMAIHLEKTHFAFTSTMPVTLEDEKLLTLLAHNPHAHSILEAFRCNPLYRSIFLSFDPKESFVAACQENFDKVLSVIGRSPYERNYVLNAPVADPRVLEVMYRHVELCVPYYSQWLYQENYLREDLNIVHTKTMGVLHLAYNPNMARSSAMALRTDDVFLQAMSRLKQVHPSRLPYELLHLYPGAIPNPIALYLKSVDQALHVILEG